MALMVAVMLLFELSNLSRATCPPIHSTCLSPVDKPN